MSNFGEGGNILLVNSGSTLFCRPISVGIEGPKTSRSSMPTRRFEAVIGFGCIARANARFTER